MNWNESDVRVGAEFTNLLLAVLVDFNYVLQHTLDNLCILSAS